MAGVSPLKNQSVFGPRISRGATLLLELELLDFDELLLELLDREELLELLLDFDEELELLDELLLDFDELLELLLDLDEELELDEGGVELAELPELSDGAELFELELLDSSFLPNRRHRKNHHQNRSSSSVSSQQISQ